MILRGSTFALLAAFCNAWVGVITLCVFSHGVSPDAAAFYKCVAAFFCLTFWLLFKKSSRQTLFKLIPYLPQIALLSLFGVFVLYFFETAAYQHSHIAVAVFTLLGASTITTFLGSYFLLNTSLSPIQSWVGIVLLGLIPTIGGFYFTTKALSLTSSIHVQLFELAEPILASVLAVIFFHQWLNRFDIMGAVFIFIAICMSTRIITTPDIQNDKLIRIEQT